MAQGKTISQLTGATTVNQQDLFLIYQTGSTLNVSVSALTQNIVNTNFTGGTMLITGLTTSSSISATTYLNLPYSGTVSGNGTLNYVSKWTGSTQLGSSIIFDDGLKVGIGTNTPQVKFHVSSAPFGGTISDSDIAVFESTGYTNVSILSSDAQNASLQFGSQSDVLGAYIRWNQANNEMSIGTANNGDNIRFVTGDEESSMFLKNGYGLGIGTLNPTQRLHVSGNTLIDGDIIYPSPSVPPVSSNSNGIKGTITWDDNYVYICINTNTWKRSQLSSW